MAVFVRSLHGVQLASSNELGWIVVGRFFYDTNCAYY